MMGYFYHISCHEHEEGSALYKYELIAQIGIIRQVNFIMMGITRQCGRLHSQRGLAAQLTVSAFISARQAGRRWTIRSFALFAMNHRERRWENELQAKDLLRGVDKTPRLCYTGVLQMSGLPERSNP